jgi:uncharacterized OsmC-like protein
VALPRAKRFEYSADVTRAGEIGVAGETPLHIPAELSPEHLVLAGLGQCTIASLDYHAQRAGVTVDAAASAHGAVARREEDERYAFVEIDCTVDVELDPPPSRLQLVELLAKAERDCFVGASLRVVPRYRWRVNGEEIDT